MPSAPVRRRLRLPTAWIALAPLLALVTLLGWALASPVGASPDDDFHLASVWCADDADTEHCKPGATDAERIVPEAVVRASCFSYDPQRSAECQDRLDFTGAAATSTDRVNVHGAYPPTFYRVMHVFVGEDVQASAMAMRVFTIVVFVALLTTLHLLLPERRRVTLAWSWLITTVPLGFFVLTSNNPSSWTTIGVGTAWIALLGYFERDGWRKAVLGVLFTLAAVMAVGSRGDAGWYTVLAIAAVIILTMRRDRRYLVEAILPTVVAIGCIAFSRLSRPLEAVTAGLGDVHAPSELLSLLAWNVLQAPFLWFGVFGYQWGLGWLDTSMPAIVWAGGFFAFIGLGFAALRSMSRRKLIVTLGGVLVLFLFAPLVLLGSGDTVGDSFQPRYLLPLAVLFAGVLLLQAGRRGIQLRAAQLWLVVGALFVAHAVALHLNMQRYVHGFDDLGWNLDAGVEWWWPIPVSPMTVWVVATLAFGALLAVLAPGLRYAGQRRSRAPLPVGAQT